MGWNGLERRMDEHVRKLLANHPNATLRNEGASLQWCAAAGAVVGINSTVLLEALTFNKPVLAFGDGIASDNGVVLEVRGDVKRFREILDYKPDLSAIRRFLHLLFQRQIPIAVQPDQFNRYPKLVEFVRQVRGLPPLVPLKPRPKRRIVPTLPDVRPSAAPIEAKATEMPVWGFLEYPDLPSETIPFGRLDCLRERDVAGLLLNDCALEEWEIHIADWLRLYKRECIPMYGEDLQWPHIRRLERAKQFGGKIALGNIQTP